MSLQEEEEQDDGHGDPADGEDEEVEGPLARHAVKHKVGFTHPTLPLPPFFHGIST